MVSAAHPLPPPLAALEFEYADFALWEHARGNDDAALSWWHSQLEGTPEMVLLPLLYPEVFRSLGVTPPKGSGTQPG